MLKMRIIRNNAYKKFLLFRMLVVYVLRVILIITKNIDNLKYGRDFPD